MNIAQPTAWNPRQRPRAAALAVVAGLHAAVLAVLLTVTQAPQFVPASARAEMTLVQASVLSAPAPAPAEPMRPLPPPERARSDPPRRVPPPVLEQRPVREQAPVRKQRPVLAAEPWPREPEAPAPDAAEVMPPVRAEAAAPAAAPALAATAPAAPPVPSVGLALQVARPDHSNCAPADYPLMLKERGVQGVVLLRVRVEADGRPGEVQVVQGSGWRLFDEAASRSVRACRFVPARRGDERHASWVEFPVRFALDG